jgi:hypothetical protein
LSGAVRPRFYFAISFSGGRHHLSAKVRTFIDMLALHSAELHKLINPYS